MLARGASFKRTTTTTSSLTRSTSTCTTTVSNRTASKTVQQPRRCYSTRFKHDYIEFTQNLDFCNKSGLDVLHDPLLNRGTAFTRADRDRLGIRGLLPPRICDIERQLERVHESFNRIADPLEKYLFLINLQDRNEALFYRFIINNIEQIAPIIYTPTVGAACQAFGHIYRRPRGMYFSAEDKGEMAHLMWNWPANEVDVIVVTDGGRILGLGDLGANGMGIPIGKLSLYVAAGGVHPGRVLPITLDVGTNNKELLADPLYLGLQRERLDGEAYYELVDEFVNAVQQRYPAALIQFEDFSPDKAVPVLEKYRDQVLSFNDDIQGTGAVITSGVLNALRAQGKTRHDLKNERFVFVGAGGAGVGIAEQIFAAITRDGAKPEEAQKCFYMTGTRGLVGQGRSGVKKNMEKFVRQDMPDGMPLSELVKKVKPTMLIGTSGTSGAFTEEIVRDMAANCERPVIFPLSNPTSKAECTAEQAFKWTNGKCLFASGSPFAPVTLPTGQTLTPTQGNNMYIFPAMGLASVLCHAKRVTDEMFFVASEALAEYVPDADLQQGKLYPPLKDIRKVSKHLMKAIIREAQRQNVARRVIREEELDLFVEQNMFKPHYRPLVNLSG